MLQTFLFGTLGALVHWFFETEKFPELDRTIGWGLLRRLVLGGAGAIFWVILGLPDSQYSIFLGYSSISMWPVLEAQIAKIVEVRGRK